MFRPLPLWVGLRYLRAKRRSGFATFISFASVLGIALGVAVLVIVLSIMNGFEREVARHILGMTSHASVFKAGEGIDDWRALCERLRALPHVRGAEPFIRGSGMINRRGHVQGVIVYGIPPLSESNVSSLHDYLGDYDLSALDAAGPIPKVLIGATLARNLDASAGDPATLIVPRWDPGGENEVPLYQAVAIDGTFHVGMHEFDASFALMSLRNAARVFGFEDRVSGIRIRFDDPTLAKRYAAEIGALLGNRYLVLDWSQFHRNFFEALKSQKRILFLILSLIIAVAAFNVIASMVMVVREKRQDIAILRTMGCAPARVLAVFVAQGCVIGAVGVGLGTLAGALSARYANAAMRVVERLFDVQFIKPDVYYINYLPTRIETGDLFLIAGTAFAICVGATLYPAWQASRIAPVEALAYD
jgi:lipoprotein-releasing system permease protein